MTQHPAQLAVGNAAWALLMAQFGGREVNVPKSRNSRTWRDLAACMGAAAADALVAMYGGDRLTVPLGAAMGYRRRKVEVARLRAQGLTPNQIAQSYTEVRRLTARTVKRLCADVRRDAHSLDLFEETQ